ncbi:MAG: hypothetical protein DBX55_06705 [Verrucomicrobia bacterium]|nr:MAG: hypothetical protein DBX55_06705 [Verrucomicrobiota bacterium]
MRARAYACAPKRRFLAQKKLTFSDFWGLFFALYGGFAAALAAAVALGAGRPSDCGRAGGLRDSSGTGILKLEFNK